MALPDLIGLDATVPVSLAGRPPAGGAEPW